MIAASHKQSTRPGACPQFARGILGHGPDMGIKNSLFRAEIGPGSILKAIQAGAFGSDPQ